METARENRQALYQLASADVHRLAEEGARIQRYDFVIFVLDVRDETPRLIVEGLRIDPTPVLAEAREKGKPDAIPFVVLRQSKANAVKILSALSSPFVRQVQEQPIRGGAFPVCIFGSGGHSVALIPFQHAN
jgi:hypothetical protein